MKSLFAIFLFPVSLVAASSDRASNTVVLDENGVANLRIETVVAEPGRFEETVFALGRIEVYPGNRAIVSSRVSGRALEVPLKLDHPVRKGDLAVVVESRQIGEPPPRVLLEAPLTGLVGSVNVVVGQPVGPDDSLAEILDLTEVYALAGVPEHLAGKLRAGQRAHITVTALSGQTFPAELEHIGAFADPAGGTIEAAFHVDNPGLKLRPGMRAEFSIVVSSDDNVVSLPRAAIQGTPSDRFVYVKDFDLPNAFVKTPVVIGRSNDRFVEIKRGLLPYDEVVVRGAYSLAFAGGGGVSLKDALDAAHGHEHNADGSEMTSNQKRADAGDGRAHDHDDSRDGHDDEHDDHDGGARLWMVVSGVLFAALLVVSFRKNRRA